MLFCWNFCFVQKSNTFPLSPAPHAFSCFSEQQRRSNFTPTSPLEVTSRADCMETGASALEIDVSSKVEAQRTTWLAHMAESGRRCGVLFSSRRRDGDSAQSTGWQVGRHQQPSRPRTALARRVAPHPRQMQKAAVSAVTAKTPRPRTRPTGPHRRSRWRT